MAIAFDAAAATAGGAIANPVTWAHTCAGSNRCLIVAVGTNGALAGKLNYGGVAATALGNVQEGNTGYRVALYKLVNPATGTANISASFAAAPAFSCRSLSFSGVDPTNPTGGFVSTANFTNAAPSLAVSASTTDVVVDALTWSFTNFPATESVGAQQTVQGGAGIGAFARTVMSTESGSATTTMSWGLSANTDWAQAAVPLHAAPVTGGGIAFAASSTVQNPAPATTIVLNLPTGTVNGETLFAILSWTSGTVTVSGAPAGWTLIGTTTTGVSNEISIATYYKVAASEGASYTWNLTGTGIYTSGALWRITGAHTSAPFNTFTGASGTGPTATAPTLTTAVGNELVAFVCAFNSEQAGLAFSTPAGFTARDNLLSSPVDNQFDCSTVQAGAAATGAVATTLTNALSTNKWAAQLVAFVPPSAVIDPRASGVISLPGEMTHYTRRNWPIAFFGFTMNDAPVTTLLPAGPFGWTDVPPEFDAVTFTPPAPFAAPLPPAGPTPAPAPGPAPPPAFTASQSIEPRISLPPQDLTDTAQWQRQAAAWMGQANQGHLQNTGLITLAANANNTAVADSRCGPDTFIGFMPKTVNATTELGNGTLYISSQTNGSFTITHANNAQTDRTFIYTLLG